METAIQVIWVIGLVGALIPTLIILKEVALVLGVLRDIHTLSRYTRDAAEGIAENVSVGAGLESLREPATKVRKSALVLRSVADQVESLIAQVSTGFYR